MIKLFKQLSLATQLTLVVAVLMIASSLVITFQLTHETQQDLEREAEHKLQQQSHDISSLLSFYYQDSFNNAKRLSDIFFNLFPQGLVQTDQSVIVGQYKTLALQDEVGVVNGNFAKPDQFTKMTGGTATIFARHGDDFLRVSTSLRKVDGSRAFGTLLGQKHPGYEKLMRGESYHGVAHLFGRDYMTVYRPVQKDNRTIAVLYIGFDLTEGLAELRKTLVNIKVGQTGYATIVAGVGHKQAGTILMHPTVEGANLAEVTSADGLKPFGRMLQEKRGIMRYQWLDSQQEMREKVAIFEHIEGWNWVILLSSYSEEFAVTSNNLQRSMIIAMAFSTLMIIVVIAFMLRRRLLPLQKITEDLVAIGAGRLDLVLPKVKADHNCRNEVILLQQGAGAMQEGLKSLVQSLGQAVVALKENAQQVNQASHDTDQAVARQSLETDQVASAMEELTATTADVADNARQAAQLTGSGREKADQGQAVAEAIHRNISGLAKEMMAAAQLISDVSEESDNISHFMTTISDVAEQTNLLALNAAIEAARAGESGRGFAVVADEVRTLAGRTQHVTGEIQQLVNRLQDKIHQAVSAIQSSNSASKKSAEEALATRNQLADIRAYMVQITDMSTSIASAAEQQAAVSESVTQSLHSIRALSNDSHHHSESGIAASKRLHQVSIDIEQKLSRFKV
ncbi:Methyl-accepting chemotaxis protein [Oceanospirillum multiglobuliferum]|uniref:Methyl-accepting transducer domain-containing protein n=1 Tax=Oceanospirillum multiglobuliferum TaxID=64969 RepID=A0A1T4PXQ6_9GAMM|nr:methyl-accepting chemotaxis protein [Oceanospirillum multiglobuliferum]OPX55423.1 hypothetical protein BTE48_08500 [Oceanospirillum multiglobuliferum]SJZ96350.1 Methyl-accepting chemotaxis protein [Oceanospirillum multiglobuliferum]